QREAYGKLHVSEWLKRCGVRGAGAVSATPTPAWKVSGRKRHLLVDARSLVLQIRVHSAAVADRDGVPTLLTGADRESPRLRHVWADRGYTGEGAAWIERALGWTVELTRPVEGRRHDV